ncbi:MAG: family N-acetyltransferase [Symbiobacteriaceae bacterium]|jgi:GNAT superfamily N-acetyltransferase|nr:family N-acetyltransferase [Symbiobacteriaceae bacterium]
MSTFHYRSPTLPADYPRLAELLSQASADAPTAQELAETDGDLPAGSILFRTLAVDSAGQISGFGEAFRYPNTKVGKFYLTVVVDRHARRTGLGSALLGRVEAFAVGQGGDYFVGCVRDDDPVSLAFGHKRGYETQRHGFLSRLDLTTWDGAPFAGLLTAVRAGGIRLALMAELGPEAEQRLYELMSRTMTDLPGYEAAQFMSFATWQNAFIRRPGAENIVVALDGDRFIGVTIMNKTDEGLYTAHTSVDRDYRGRHIALGLKLFSIDLARERGVTVMTAGNDSLNAPMIAVNRKLGYVPQAGEYDVAKRLG